MQRTCIVLIVTLLLGLFLGQVGYADGEKRPSAQKSAPSLAGFVPVPVEHSCTQTYVSCSAQCRGAGGTACEAECLSDCSVCSLDFGEESEDLCRR